MSLTASLPKEVVASDLESDYAAVELLWNVFVKAAHSKNSPKEFARLQLLVADLDSREGAAFAQHPSVDTLHDLHPPLETVLADRYERLDAQTAASEVATIRALRSTRPKEAATALLSLLKRIRNKRVHGFKTQDGPRDAEILGAARPLLRLLCAMLVQ